MFKQLKDYRKGKIYCIRNEINDDIYIGSTCQTLSQRMTQHRTDCKKDKNPNRKLYVLMNEINDKDVFYHELIEDYPCEHVYQSRKREGELIREMKPSLNMNVECRSAKEYQDTYREYFNQYKKDYYINNKEYLNECNRLHYENNKDQIKEHQKIYREEHRDELNQKSREKYEQ